MRGILFDKDGTLLDFEASWSRLYRELAQDLADGDAGQAERLLLRGGLDPATGRIRSGSVLAAGNTRDIVGVWFPDLAGGEFASMVGRIDGVFYQNGIRYSVPVPGLVETLEALAAEGVAMGVATSDGTAAARAALDALAVGKYLPHVFGYDSVAQPKPAPDIVHAFCDAIGAEPQEIAVVGDNTHDLDMALSAGAGAIIGVLTGNGTEDDLKPLAHAVLASIADLPGWLRAARSGGKSPIPNVRIL